MAYVLGFFAADGNMIKNKRGAHFIEFSNTEKSLLEKIKKAMGLNHKISLKVLKNQAWKQGYRLQIGSKEIFYDLLKLGMTPNKSKTIKLSIMPNKYFSHFLRGYFDGDGNVGIYTYQKKDRVNPSTIISVGFTSGSYEILSDIKNKLFELGIIKGSSISYNRGHRLIFSINDSKELYNFMYKNSGNLFIPRKKLVFEKYFNKE